ncbi:retron Eco8 family effector endonuclease [Shewanella putrefaciens]|uniref:retron Eco8 family effector endonuclease n=1 Tax=Shewanella putrefaciens TaxID=24 RepID=UPI003D7BF2EC
MAIKSIRIKNLLSFEDFTLENISDINCIIGKNNVGKSNLLKVLDFFYKSLNDEKVIPLPLRSNYSSHGTITITYDTSRLEDVIRGGYNNSNYQKNIYNKLYKSETYSWEDILNRRVKKNSFTLTLKIKKDNSTSWSVDDKEVRSILHRIYPFFSIDTRRMDLYNWKYLWSIVTKLKFINTKNLSRNKIVDFFDENVSSKSNSYRDYVESIREITRTSAYSYEDKLLQYISVGLDGQSFNIDGFELNTQSDGTNSFKFIETFLNLIITLTRREFITPTVFIDEPEIGLHPKRCEDLIQNLNDVYVKFKKADNLWEKGKYRTPYPKIILSTHSPAILKSVIKLFNTPEEHKIYHLTNNAEMTVCSVMNSYFNDKRFLNLFSENEAKLFFSNFILFVEGATEIELFGNKYIKELFPTLRKIDLYETNEVMLKAIRPTNSNLLIPYLVIYDADKMIDVDMRNEKINFLSKEVNLKLITESYKKNYWNSDGRGHYLKLKNIILLEKQKKELTNNKIKFSNFNIKNIINQINNILRKNESTHINHNTIEGCVINEKNIKIFIKWLICEYEEKVKIGCKGSPNTVIDIHRTKPKNKLDINKAFDAIYGKNENSNNIVITGINLNFSEYIKREHFKNLFREFIKRGVNKSDLTIILRMVFEGKSDTLCSKKNNNFKHVGQEVKHLITLTENMLTNKLPYGSSKTGGWVSSFIEFAIQECKSGSHSEADVKSKFSSAFPEIFGIITTISSSIE